LAPADVAAVAVSLKLDTHGLGYDNHRGRYSDVAAAAQAHARSRGRLVTGDVLADAGRAGGGGIGAGGGGSGARRVDDILGRRGRAANALEDGRAGDEDGDEEAVFGNGGDAAGYDIEAGPRGEDEAAAGARLRRLGLGGAGGASLLLRAEAEPEDGTGADREEDGEALHAGSDGRQALPGFVLLGEVAGARRGGPSGQAGPAVVVAPSAPRGWVADPRRVEALLAAEDARRAEAGAAVSPAGGAERGDRPSPGGGNPGGPGLGGAAAEGVAASAAAARPVSMLDIMFEVGDPEAPEPALPEKSAEPVGTSGSASAVPATTSFSWVPWEPSSQLRRRLGLPARVEPSPAGEIPRGGSGGAAASDGAEASEPAGAGGAPAGPAGGAAKPLEQEAVPAATVVLAAVFGDASDTETEEEVEVAEEEAASSGGDVVASPQPAAAADPPAAPAPAPPPPVTHALPFGGRAGDAVPAEVVPSNRPLPPPPIVSPALKASPPDAMADFGSLRALLRRTIEREAAGPETAGQPVDGADSERRRHRRKHRRHSRRSDDDGQEGSGSGRHGRRRRKHHRD